MCVCVRVCQVFEIGFLLVELSLESMYVCVNMYTLRSRRLPTRMDALTHPADAQSIYEKYQVRVASPGPHARAHRLHAHPLGPPARLGIGTGVQSGVHQVQKLHARQLVRVRLSSAVLSVVPGESARPVPDPGLRQHCPRWRSGVSAARPVGFSHGWHAWTDWPSVRCTLAAFIRYNPEPARYARNRVASERLVFHSPVIAPARLMDYLVDFSHKFQFQSLRSPGLHVRSRRRLGARMQAHTTPSLIQGCAAFRCWTCVWFHQAALYMVSHDPRFLTAEELQRERTATPSTGNSRGRHDDGGRCTVCRP